MKRTKVLRVILLVLILAAVLFLVWKVVQKNREQELDSSIPEPTLVYTGDDFVMDTFLTQKIYDEDGEAVVRAVAQEMQQIEQQFSPYLSDSEIAQVNAQAGLSAVPVSDTVFSVIKRCLSFSEETAGIYELTIGPLVQLWNITGENPTVPTADAIGNALSYVDYRNVTLDEQMQTVYLDRPGVLLDFGATIKGYATEQGLRIMQEAEIGGGIISLGGNVAATGVKEDGTPFSIGLRDPQKTANDFFGILKVSDQVISTSGPYERYFEQDGKRYHHILDPKTGYPAESDLQTVAVISADGLLSDFLSTYLFMMGKEYLLEHLEEADYHVIAIDTDNRVHCSSALKDAFTLVSDSGYQMADES